MSTHLFNAGFDDFTQKSKLIKYDYYSHKNEEWTFISYNVKYSSFKIQF